jgi:UDP-galactopyranose mutase
MLILYVFGMEVPSDERYWFHPHDEVPARGYVECIEDILKKIIAVT